ncbi:DUF3592 domain-containing protein [Streptomyces sp. ISL-12]|uniref:DUF3592 domain-containing protein n=1 Tax=Streptomyces sp. ISL-12 TaxID=2819177 RepID=UPI001BE73CF0|nr:DUF3592 domain-containing protein [Streptomyces sp. ISL-12]MBT2409094.1 DUF3592 domain-containing protein [Streptomyces sp. ISL-12]
MPDTLLGILLCGAAGALLLWPALRDAAQVRRLRRLRRHGVRTSGVVVDGVRVRDGDGLTWAPIIAFADQYGYRVEFTPKARGTGLGFATGRQVPVVCLADDPQSARVDMRRHLTGPVCFPLGGAVVFLGAGVAIAVTA